MESDTSRAAEHLLDWLRDAHAMEEQEERTTVQWIEHNMPGLMRQFLMRADNPDSQVKR